MLSHICWFIFPKRVISRHKNPNWKGTEPCTNKSQLSPGATVVVGGGEGEVGGGAEIHRYLLSECCFTWLWLWKITQIHMISVERLMYYICIICEGSRQWWIIDVYLSNDFQNIRWHHMIYLINNQTLQQM